MTVRKITKFWGMLGFAGAMMAGLTNTWRQRQIDPPWRTAIGLPAVQAQNSERGAFLKYCHARIRSPAAS